MVTVKRRVKSCKPCHEHRIAYQLPDLWEEININGFFLRLIRLQTYFFSFDFLRSLKTYQCNQCITKGDPIRNACRKCDSPSHTIVVKTPGWCLWPKLPIWCGQCTRLQRSTLSEFVWPPGCCQGVRRLDTLVQKYHSFSHVRRFISIKYVLKLSLFFKSYPL